MGKGKYLRIWEKELSFILSAIEKGGDQKRLSPEEFQQSGNRISSGYSFRLSIINGIVPTKSNTAVARDLKEILDYSRDFRHIAKGKSILIRMNKSFELEVKVI